MKAHLKIMLLVCLAAASVYAQGSLAVINGARFEVKYPVAPGTYAQAYGQFSGVTTTYAATVPLPTELGGISVLVGGVPAPLYAVAPDVVSFLVPGGAQPGRTPVSVVRGSESLAVGNADVVPVSPGIFFVLADPLAQGGILNEQSQYAVEASPARRGQAIQIFGTGQGALDIAVPEGGVAPSGTLARAKGQTKVYVSVDEAQVTFSGLSPQFPGLWQINAIVPNKSYISGQVPIVVTIDGIPSNQTSFWVAQ